MTEGPYNHPAAHVLANDRKTLFTGVPLPRRSLFAVLLWLFTGRTAPRCSAALQNEPTCRSWPGFMHVTLWSLNDI